MWDEADRGPPQKLQGLQGLSPHQPPACAASAASLPPNVAQPRTICRALVHGSVLPVTWFFPFRPPGSAAGEEAGGGDKEDGAAGADGAPGAGDLGGRMEAAAAGSSAEPAAAVLPLFPPGWAACAPAAGGGTEALGVATCFAPTPARMLRALRRTLCASWPRAWCATATP